VPADRDALRVALKRTASALKADGVPFALAGGYALWAHGAPESENDVDFVIAEEDTERAVDVLENAGFEVTRPPEDWLFKVGCDFGRLLPHVRAVREQLDWERLRTEVKDNDFAVAFLFLTDRLGISPQ
jgi:hypothetical protein